MSNKKISALTGATTPLAGTEVLPIVQSSATVNVSVANLTAGRAISASSVTASTGNFIVGTSGKGIDFSITPGTGTSELLADYEEGTWTPVAAFGGASVGLTYASRSASYTLIGNRVLFTLYVNVSNKGSSTGQFQLSGLPFTSKSSVEDFTFTIMVGGTNGIALPLLTTQFCAFLPGGSTTIVLYTSGSSTPVQSITNTECGTAFDMRISGSYPI